MANDDSRFKVSKDAFNVSPVSSLSTSATLIDAINKLNEIATTLNKIINNAKGG